MKMRKIIAIVAAVLMLCSILPISAMAADTEIVFNLGANGSATHADGTSKTTYSETVSGYTLNITNGTQFYTGARDAKGNSCLKLGSSKNVGSFKFTVPDDVTSVIIEIAKYKTNSAKMNINGTTYTLTKNSNDGAYDLITIDTTSTKTISVAVSSGPRAMVNSIKFVIAAAAGDCEHDWVTEQTKAPDCTNAGENTLTCSKCGESKTETVNALGHDWEIISEEEATCTADGSTTYECAACGEDKVETIPALPHNYVDGVCAACGAEMPLEVTITFGADKAQRTEYSSTKQVWQNDGLTLVNEKGSSTNNVGDYTNPARFYKSSTIVISFPGMTSLIINAPSGEYGTPWATTLNNAELTYTNEGTVYTVTFANPVDSVTLTASAQIRANSITASAVKPDCEHDYVGVETQAPTCTVEGVMTYTCSKCEDSYTKAIAVIPHDYVEDIIDSTCTTTGTKTYECSVCFDSYDEVIPVKNHNYVDDVCSDCGAVKAYKGTLIFDADKENRTEYSSQIQVWESEGLTFTNNKGASTTNVGDYGAPGRFYKNSEIIIEFPEMKTLIIDANVEKKDDYAWTDTLNNAGLSFTEANGIYTITFTEAVNSIELTAANQLRANSITAKVLCGHAYDNEFDADCNKCGDIREVDAPIAFNGNSISEDVEGLAFRFTVDAKIAIAFERITEIDYAQSSFGEYKLNMMGAKLSNGFEEIDIPAVYAWNYTDSSVSYAVRILELDEDFKKDCTITAKPYIVIEKDGVEITVYGAIQSASYNGVLNG